MRHSERPPATAKLSTIPGRTLSTEEPVDVVPVGRSVDPPEVLPVLSAAAVPEVLPVSRLATTPAEVLPVEPKAVQKQPRSVGEADSQIQNVVAVRPGEWVSTQSTESPHTPSALEYPFPLGAAVFVWRAIDAVWVGITGVLTLIVALAVLAALPVLQLLSLGYLLEAGGRIGRTGKFREGFIGLRTASRVGELILGVWLCLLPARLISSMWLSAELIDPGGAAATGWKIALILFTALVVVHIALACSVGGRLWQFLFPFVNPILLVLLLRRGDYYTEARDAVWEFVASLRLPYYFWLGFRGFVGGFAWLAIPVTLLAVGRKVPILGFIGAFLLMIVLMFVPFLQMHFTARNRFVALFDIFNVIRYFTRSPLAFTFSFFFTLLLAVPLYLLKIEIVPREAAWLPSIFFVVSIFPARLLTGWAYGRALKREDANVVLRILGSMIALPLMFATSFIYVILVFFTQYTSWSGIWSLYEQHAFLLPVPFVGM